MARFVVMGVSGCGPVTFLFLNGSHALISKRMAARTDHFMPPALLDSQFATLEMPDADEGTISVDIDKTPDAIVAELISQI